MESDNHSLESNDQEDNKKHCERMERILVDAVYTAFSALDLESTTTTVEIDKSDSKLISYTEQFKFNLGIDEECNPIYSDWLELSCHASKTHPSIWATIKLQYCNLDRVDALLLANQINVDFPCSVSVIDENQFQVSSYISFWGYLEADMNSSASLSAADNATKNMLAILFRTSMSLYQSANNFVDIQSNL